MSSTPSAPADQLRALAARVTTTAFHAVYRAHRSRPASSATLVVDHTARAVRVDVSTHHTTATLIAGPSASFACTRTRHARACFRVARRGQPIRAPFNLAPQKVFTGDLAALARHPERYAVTAAGTRPATSTVPAGQCFRVRPRQTSTAAAPAGTYCFAADGILTAVTYPSGNTLRLVRVRLQQPPARTFRPYSSPTPLP